MKKKLMTGAIFLFVCSVAAVFGLRSRVVKGKAPAIEGFIYVEGLGKIEGINENQEVRVFADKKTGVEYLVVAGSTALTTSVEAIVPRLGRDGKPVLMNVEEQMLYLLDQTDSAKKARKLSKR